MGNQAHFYRMKAQGKEEIQGWGGAPGAMG